MKSALISLFLLALLLTPVYPIYAQNPATLSATPNIKPPRPTPMMSKNPTATRASELRSQPLPMPKEKVSTKEAMMKQRLAKFKNQDKATLAQNVTMNLNRINQNYVKIMLNHLDNLSQILVKLESRLVQAPSGTDTTEATRSINDAKASISSASGMLNLQMAKDYSIEATSEATIRPDINTSRNMLRTDLQANKEMMMRVRQSVLLAIESVAMVLGGSNGTK